MSASHDHSSPLLTVNDLQVNIADQVILEKINLEVLRGQIVTIIGPNGAGKSTLIRAILGLIKPTFGTIAMQAGIKVGYMPQKLMLESLMPITVHRFLTLNNNKKFTAIDANIANSWQVLQELKIEHLLASPLQKISGGELQRVLLTRALINKPNLLVLDEPVQGVDITGQTELYGLINDVCSRHNVGILMVSHDLHLVMARTDEVICLNKHICCSGHPQAVSSNPQFLSLFGNQAAEQLAIYAHHHNHTHDLAGKVINESCKH